MRKILAVMAVLSIVTAAGVAKAAPVAYYNPANGNVVFNNDLAGALNNISLLSGSSSLTQSSALLDVAGTTKDDSEFPDALTSLNSPVGQYYIGAVVKPGTPLADLTMRYRNPGQSTGANIIGVVVEVPEPATFAMAGLGLVGIVAAARRKA